MSPRAGEHDGFATLISFEVEKHGQDSCAIGTLNSGKRVRVLKQYKYSASPSKYAISAGELKKIVRILKQSEKKANQEEELPTDLVLCTNRRLAAGASRLPQFKAIRIEHYNAADARAGLERNALRFGIFNPDELHTAIERITGHLFTIATSSSNKLSKKRFEENLAGHREPQSLVLGECASRRLSELEELGKQTLDLPIALADRTHLSTSATEFQNDAIIAFVGDGGCGKTTAIWQLLHQALITEPPQALTQMIATGSQSIGEVIERWRGAANSATADGFAIERVVRANEGRPRPIVILGLDGIDETDASPARKDAAARIVNFFWGEHLEAKRSGKPPVARLIVSCRKPSDLDPSSCSPSGSGISGDIAPRYVLFEEFRRTNYFKL